jgi:fibrillarin-like pre-rRNA processing protein
VNDLPVKVMATLPMRQHAHCGIHTDGNDIFTRLMDGAGSGGARTSLGEDGHTYRSFPPSATKLAALVKVGVSSWPFRSDSRVLYLGAGAGTTVSYVSDICHNGTVIAVEFAPEPFMSLVDMARDRPNVLPILADARDPSAYAVQVVQPVDVIYQDVAQRDQWGIAHKNAEALLKGSGLLVLVVKARSVDVAKRASDVYAEVAAEASASGYQVVENVDIGDFAEGHSVLIAKRR